MTAVECGYGSGSPWAAGLCGAADLEAWGRKLYPGSRMFLQDTLHHQPRGPVSGLKEEPLPPRSWPVDNSSSRTFVVISGLFTLVFSEEKVKRILFGDPVISHDQWNTAFIVMLEKTWSCISDQVDHPLGKCQRQPFCSGSLITYDLVVTACHCVSYAKSFYRKPRVTFKQKPGGSAGTWGYYLVKTYFHLIYSGIAILAGGPLLTKMSQKRHASRVFPHPDYEANFLFGSDNDVAVVQLCYPFKSTELVKTAPLMNLDGLKPHYDRIMLRNAACLSAGYGLTEDGLPDVLRYTWRYLTCSPVVCSKGSTTATDQTCRVCTLPIFPRLGSPYKGDSGSPYVCDTYWIAVHTAGHFLFPRYSFNKSVALGFPLYCIKNALTTERLDYYKSVPGDQPLEPLGPLGSDRRRRRTFDQNQRYL